MANALHFSKFKVENFKRFENFEMDNLGQFNVIVGDNNVGKSSILEALMIDPKVEIFLQSLKYILFNVKRFDELKDSYLYHYLNQNTNNKTGVIKLEAYLNENPEANWRLEIHIRTGHLEGIKSNLPQRDSDLHAGSKNGLIENSLSPASTQNIEIEENANIHPPFIPFQVGYRHNLATYFDANIEGKTARLNQLKSDLKILIPDLTDIRQRSSEARTTILAISREGANQPMPLGTYGDGVIKLFRILVEMQIHSGNRLMIDEIDTGIHYKRMKLFWQTVIRSAKNNNVQLFTTTHNEECIWAFTEALKEEGEEFQNASRIIHLGQVSEKTKQVKAYNYKYNEFAHALDVGNELR